MGHGSRGDSGLPPVLPSSILTTTSEVDSSPFTDAKTEAQRSYLGKDTTIGMW